MSSPATPAGQSLAGARIGDRIFKGLLMLAALAVPVLLVFLVAELWTGARLAIGEFGLGFLTLERVGPRQRAVRRVAAHLRHAGVVHSGAG